MTYINNFKKKREEGTYIINLETRGRSQTKLVLKYLHKQFMYLSKQKSTIPQAK